MMEIKGKVHCFFEQSGTFKREFIKLGIPAEDYDIQNNFGETDHITDLFAEIDAAYDGRPSIFDNITNDDLVMAFFPCIYFCANNRMYFDGSCATWIQRGMTEVEKNKLILERSRSRQRFYELMLEMFTACTIKGVRMVVENPFTQPHYLNNNFPYNPKLIDTNRRMRGDSFVKPTQYWFHNCEPTHGISNTPPRKTLSIMSLSGHKGGLCSEEKSMIAPEYAHNFICDFILGRPSDKAPSQLDMFDIAEGK